MLPQWTIMLYLAGDNNLESFGQHDLQELKSVGSTPEVRLIAEFDAMGDGGTRRYVLSRDHSLDADCVAELPEANTGDPAALRRFVRWGLDEHPAERTALILWNHGSGWRDDNIYALARSAGVTESELPASMIRSFGHHGIGRSLFAPSIAAILRYPAAVRAIMFDDTSKDFLDNRELRNVLDGIVLSRQGRKLDLLGFDACLMSMVEVAAEIKAACRYMVGSQEIEPGEGWPYHAIVARLVAEPTMGAEELGRAIVDCCAEHYTHHPTGIPITSAALRLEQLPALATAIDRLAALLIDKLQHGRFFGATLLPVLREVHKFRDQQFADLRHLARLLAAHADDDALAHAAAEIDARLDPQHDESVIVANRALPPHAGVTETSSPRDLIGVTKASPSAGEAHGLSIYVPLLGTVSPAYADLEFGRQTRWSRFLHTFNAS